MADSPNEHSIRLARPILGAIIIYGIADIAAGATVHESFWTSTSCRVLEHRLTMRAVLNLPDESGN